MKIDPDGAGVFRDDHSVNEALRSLICIARRQTEAARQVVVKFHGSAEDVSDEPA